MSDSGLNICELCGEPMPQGEDMFKFHGYSGPCPKPPKKREKAAKAAESVAHDLSIQHDSDNAWAKALGVEYGGSITESVQMAKEALTAQARLEEARWWLERGAVPQCSSHDDCLYCQRIIKLQRELQQAAK